MITYRIRKAFKRLDFYTGKQYAFTVIPTIEIVLEKQENDSYYFDFELSAFFWYCGFLINPKW